jgi:D-cysteine desulfhydrase
MQTLTAMRSRRLNHIRILLPSLFLLSARAMSSDLPSCRFPYVAPSWCQGLLCSVPEHGRLHLANLPTPLYRMTGRSNIFQKLDDLGISFFIKRDDATHGVELGGNKIRKLEFLLADALASNCDSVVTIGGEQSNHCRATAAAARMVGLDPHIILRARSADSDLGLVGNLLVDRMVGSSIYTCTPGEYGRIGSEELVARLCAHLKTAGKRPYPIPVGGSNAIGSWGYIHAVDELVSQWKILEKHAGRLDHIVFACGSGGTATGIALGIALAHGAATGASPHIPHVHAIGVCDSPDYFYSYIAKIADDMGLRLPPELGLSTEDFVRAHMTGTYMQRRVYRMETNQV